MMDVKLTSLVLLFLVAFTLGDDESGDLPDHLFEVDVRKLVSNTPVEFGAEIYTHNYTKYEAMMKRLGPVVKTGYWQTVWEVSGAAPAPRYADDEMMNRWVGSIYWNLAHDIEPMENTSRMLQENDFQVIAGTTTAPNTYYATPSGIERFRNAEQAKKDGVEVEPEEWTEERAKEESQRKDKDYFLFMREFVNDFAKFWAISLEYLEKIKVRLPYIELCFEPDSHYFMHMEPQDYVDLLKKLREELRARNISDDKHLFVGFGASQPTKSRPYLEMLGKDREAYDVIHAWNFHITDEGKPLHEIEREILGFKQSVKALIPKSWPRKPIFVSKFKFEPTDNFAFDDVEFNGDIENCYHKIFGQKVREDYDLANSPAQSPATGVRLLASLFLQYSLGVSKSVYQMLTDEAWSHSCAGFFDRKGREKQIFAAFSTFLPYIEEGSVAIKKQWTNKDECFTVALKSKTRIVFAVANTGKSACARSFSLSGVNANKLTEGFTVAYNNGTVSLTAENAWESLILKQPLDYDVYESEEKKDGHVVEFDVVIGPHSSTTAVLELKPIPEKQEGAEVKKESVNASKVEHAEL